MAYGSVAITAGSGTAIEVFTTAGSTNVQVVRLDTAGALTRSSWTLSLTASTSQIAADVTRVGMLFNAELLTDRVWLNFGSTAPTTSVHDWYLDPGDRWEVPSAWVEQAVSMLGRSAGSVLYYTLGTAA